MDMRIEKDSIGEIEVPSKALYGAQTARSIYFFNVGADKMPLQVIYALALIKKAAAHTHLQHKKIAKNRAELISAAADEILKGNLDDEFPLKVWQTGSGTQTNMNVNEVIARQAMLLSPEKIKIHPNDEVNLAQSSNDTFPTAMHIAAKLEVENRLLKALDNLKNSIMAKAKEFAGITKIGRTHLMDAVPISLAAEFNCFGEQLNKCIELIKNSALKLQNLAIGGTAVGSGINCYEGFDSQVCDFISKELNSSFKPAANKYAMLASHEELLQLSSSLKICATSLFKIANDIRFLGSGPRCGLQELILPANEPGSSIMPGKVNPTQCEMMTQVCVQVMGYDAAVSIAGSQGNFQLNVFKPLIIFNILNSIRLLSDGVNSFEQNLIKGLTVNKTQIEYNLENSLMLVTALTPKIGYDKAAEVAKKAYHENISLKSACEKLGYMSAKDFQKNIFY